MAITALTAFDDSAGIMKRFSRAAEKLVVGGGSQQRLVLETAPVPGVAVTAKAIPMAAAPWGTYNGSPARRRAAANKKQTIIPHSTAASYET